MERGIPWRLVTVDLDGTLTRGHGWRGIARAFGRLDAYDETSRKFFAHEIEEDAHLADLLDDATGHTVTEVEALVARTPKLRGIREGIRNLPKDGARVALLTHHPTYVVEWYRRTFGVDDSEGVDAQTIDRGTIGPPTRVRAD